MNKFKNITLQKLYEHLIKTPPYNDDGSENHGSSIHSAFWKGFYGVAYKHIIPQTWEHAAWAAGKTYKEAQNE